MKSNMEIIGDYEYSKKDLIGHGAFAVVFKGRERQKPENTVAIKCITKKNLAKSQNLLSKEIKILKELSDLQHENVVALFDCKETSHHVYLVMEYCNGGDLADFLQAKGTLSEDTISSFLRQIAGAMRALVGKGIVHRDLKPQNILLCHAPGKKDSSPLEMELKIADFGFARFLQDGVMAATLCGSPMYMAPEVIMSIQYDAKADLWSVGTIVYQCLTGKAPFQAQTPQQLKMFYERNANLQPNIPPGTSAELRDLLMRLLKRNAKDRIDFEDFFHHPFHSPQKSQPVAVPRRRSRSSQGESPPVKSISASPLSGQVFASPPKRVSPPRRDLFPEPMDTEHPLAVAPNARRKRASTSPEVGAVARPRSPVEDFVMVPENLPTDPVLEAAAGAPCSQSPKPVDLNAIFSNKSPESPMCSPRGVNTEGVTYTKLSSPQQISPSRPSTLPGVQGSPANAGPTVGSTQPIPVPSQVRAYEKIQRSTGASPSSPSPVADRTPSLESPKLGVGIPIPKRASCGSLPDVGSITPPSVQFTIGTPEAAGWKHSSQGQFMTPPSSSSPHRRQLHRIATTPASLGTQTTTTHLPPIVGSPTKVPENLQFPSPELDTESPGSPLVAPFGSMRKRALTCPDNIAAVGFNADMPTGTSLVPVSEVGVEHILYHGTSSASRLSEQLLKAAFGATSPNTAGLALAKQLAQNPPGNLVVPYSSSNTSLNRVGSNSSLQNTSDSSNRQRHSSTGDDSGVRSRRYSSCYDDSPSPLPFAQSPPTMEGPVMFIAPELAEETLMDKEHNDTVAKLNFILALVECIIELAQSRSSPLSQSMTDPSTGSNQGNTGSLFTLDHIAFLSESQRRLEQLVLYIRALQLLTSSIQLAKTEVKDGRLQPSNTVKSILREMNNYFHQCLSVCRNLHSQGVSFNPEVHPQAAAITADKLIYSYAIEMCQTAALDELFGNPQECFRRYRNAQILLHSLAQQADNESDRKLLSKYRVAVEKRLYYLQSQGYVFARDTSNS